MKIAVTLTEEQRWNIVDIESATWKIMRNATVDIKDLNELKKLCEQYLKYPIIQALTGE